MTNEILHANQKLNFFSLRGDGKVKKQKETICPTPHFCSKSLDIIGFRKIKQAYKGPIIALLFTADRRTFFFAEPGQIKKIPKKKPHLADARFSSKFCYKGTCG